MSKSKSTRNNQYQMWVDKRFKEFLKEIIRKKNLIEHPLTDFSFGDITKDIACNGDLKIDIENRLLREGKRDETKLF